MSSVSDDRAARLRAGGFSNIHDWLLSATGESGGAVNDLWGLFLAQRGYAGQHNSALFAYLGDSGYVASNHLSDRLAAFWADPGPLPGPLGMDSQ